MSTARPPRTDSAGLLAGGESGEALLSIAAVERETGLGKDTLRAWERRYGFPLPQRDAAGVRGYPRALVERLRLVRRVLLNGQRPGRLFALPPRELDAVLASISARPPQPAVNVDGHAALPLAGCLATLRAGDPHALRHWLARGLARMGLAAFVIDGLAPLTAAIGRAWLDGTVAVHEEHRYSEVVQSVLRSALLPFQAGLEPAAPRVLLTTVPGEVHGLALLMAEALLTLEACRCVSLGVQTPIDDIVAASRAYRIDVVVLGFSGSLPGPQAVAALQDLRARLPGGTAIWAGGGSPALRAHPSPGIHAMLRLADLVGAVARWRKDSSPETD